MLKRRTLHRDMADVNVYTARRLKSMALSLGGLAQAFADEIGGQGHLTKEDGLAAMQTAASAVCGDCTRCNLYYGSRRDDSYYLYYLLRTFEQKGKIDLEDMPRLFHEICSQREAYLRELNRSLGRATMNLGWKNRFLESRDAVIVQFRELAAILERVELKDHMGVCLDTCHVYDAGYDIVDHLDDVLERFDRVVGLSKLKAVHLNDSKNPFESHKRRFSHSAASTGDA